MVFNPLIHHRHSIRLKNYDYNCPGAYFITICTKKDVAQLSVLTSNKLKLTKSGRIVSECWQGLTKRFSIITLDEYVIMPDHFHGIIIINDFCITDWVGQALPLHKNAPVHIGQLPQLSNVIGAFKSLSAIAVNKILDQSGNSIWQRNYYERIIRSEKELNEIREYIKNNPKHL